jgi:hypothetical protein
MTFEFMRSGWPNTAAIFALALLPLAIIADLGQAPTEPPSLRAGVHPDQLAADGAMDERVLTSVRIEN